MREKSLSPRHVCERCRVACLCVSVPIGRSVRRRHARAIFVCMPLCDHEVVWASALSVSFVSQIQGERSLNSLEGALEEAKRAAADEIQDLKSQVSSLRGALVRLSHSLTPTHTHTHTTLSLPAPLELWYLSSYPSSYPSPCHSFIQPSINLFHFAHTVICVHLCLTKEVSRLQFMFTDSAFLRG